MFNTSGTELLVILLVALIVLGPEKLPEAARKLGGFMRELRRMSAGFQAEVRDALREPVEAVNDTVQTVRSGFTTPDDRTHPPQFRQAPLPVSDLPPPVGDPVDLPPPPS